MPPTMHFDFVIFPTSMGFNVNFHATRPELMHESGGCGVLHALSGTYGGAVSRFAVKFFTGTAHINMEAFPYFDIRESYNTIGFCYSEHMGKSGS